MMLQLLFIFGLLAGMQNAERATLKSLVEAGNYSEAESFVRYIFAHADQEQKIAQIHSLAAIWMHEFHFAEAIWLLRRFWLAFPQNSQFTMDYAKALHAAGRYPEAEQAYLWGTRQFPAHGAMWNYLGLLYKAQGLDATVALQKAFQYGEKRAAVSHALYLWQPETRAAARTILYQLLSQDAKRPLARILFALDRLD